MARPVDAMLPITPQQLGELFDRHAGALALYAAQWTNQADDCVQESLIELARQPVAPDNPAAWLYRVVRNRALNAARAAQRRSLHEQAAVQGRSELHPASGDATAASTELIDALDMLEQSPREVVVLRIWGQLSWQEIADVVGGSKSGAQRLYVDALQQLHKLWEPEGLETRSCRTK